MSTSDNFVRVSLSLSLSLCLFLSCIILTMYEVDPAATHAPDVMINLLVTAPEQVELLEYVVMLTSELAELHCSKEGTEHAHERGQKRV